MRASSQALDVLGRTRDVVSYQHNPALSGRPVALMLAGALLAVVSAALCGMLAYQTWYQREIASDTGLFGVSLLFVFYVAGAYVFALAYELYDVERAVRLTLMLAILGVLALGFMIGVLIVLAYIKTGAGIALSEEQGGKAFGVLTAFADEEAEDGVKPQQIPGFSMITCGSCERAFFPVPPSAICPWCDTAYLTA